MAERGLIDTSVVIDLDLIDAAWLPDETAISVITLENRLQWAAASWDSLPRDAEVARAYGRIYAALKAYGSTSHRQIR